uniref:Uncharacterized protein n=1 Tax=Caenorhabditis japonica TaxID=281687 RepID=A0A8R1IG33_CAEJA
MIEHKEIGEGEDVVVVAKLIIPEISHTQNSSVQAEPKPSRSFIIVFLCNASVSRDCCQSRGIVEPPPIGESGDGDDEN